jgi:hypothetical protein
MPDHTGATATIERQSPSRTEKRTLGVIGDILFVYAYKRHYGADGLPVSAIADRGDVDL